MPDITLSGFKSNVVDVARPNRFILNFTPPTGPGADRLSWTVKGAQIPGRTIGEIILYWQGMQAKIAGDPTFEDFTVTFLNDYDQIARTAISDWMQLINEQITNIRTPQPAYKILATMDQLGREGDILSSWILDGFWPKTLDPIDMNQESVDQAAEFNVTFSVDIWTKG